MAGNRSGWGRLKGRFTRRRVSLPAWVLRMLGYGCLRGGRRRVECVFWGQQPRPSEAPGLCKRRAGGAAADGVGKGPWERGNCAQALAVFYASGMTPSLRVTFDLMGGAAYQGSVPLWCR